jgi:hypothetical protein
MTEARDGRSSGTQEGESLPSTASRDGLLSVAVVDLAEEKVHGGWSSGAQGGESPPSTASRDGLLSAAVVDLAAEKVRGGRSAQGGEGPLATSSRIWEESAGRGVECVGGNGRDGVGEGSQVGFGGWGGFYTRVEGFDASRSSVPVCSLC